VEAVLVSSDGGEQPPQLARAPPLRPVRVDRGQMDAEDAEPGSGEDDFEERAPGG